MFLVRLLARLWHLPHGAPPPRRAIEAANAPGAGPHRQQPGASLRTDSQLVADALIGTHAEREPAIDELLRRHGELETRRRLRIARENFDNLARALP